VLLEEFSEEGGGVFAEFAVVWAEGGEEMAVDIEFADDFFVDEDGNDNFGFGFERAGEIAGIGVDVVDDDGFASGGSGATDTLVERDAGVRGHSAFEGTENEDVAVGFLFEHVKTNPVVAREARVEEGDDAFHEGFARGSGASEIVQGREKISGFGVCGGHRNMMLVAGKESSVFLQSGFRKVKTIICE
jgi:hypothetical protein